MRYNLKSLTNPEEFKNKISLPVKSSDMLETKTERSCALLILNLAVTLEPLHRGSVPEVILTYRKTGALSGSESTQSRVFYLKKIKTGIIQFHQSA